MSTGKINQTQKQEVKRKILEHRFLKDFLDLCEKSAQLALDVYDDVFSEATRKRMYDLPNDWLPETGGIYVLFPADYAKLTFSGFSTAAKYSVMSFSPPKDHYLHKDVVKRVPFGKHSNSGFGTRSACLKQYEPSDVLAQRFEEIQNLARTYKTSTTKADADIEAILSKSTSVHNLKQIWPELEPFLKPYEKVKGGALLPAVLTKDLNALLNLPVE